jgi:hypothetical protein
VRANVARLRADRVDAAEDNVVDSGRIDAGPGHQLRDDVGAEVSAVPIASTMYASATSAALRQGWLEQVLLYARPGSLPIRRCA